MFIPMASPVEALKRRNNNFPAIAHLISCNSANLSFREVQIIENLFSTMKNVLTKECLSILLKFELHI